MNSHGQVKLADFGIAFFDEQNRDNKINMNKSATKTSPTRHREASAVDFVGTAAYMSPERLDARKFNKTGIKGYGPPTDVWAFGLTLYACVIGSCPMPVNASFFELVHAICEDPSPSLNKHDHRYPDDLCDFLDLCLKKDPSERATASELLTHRFITQRYIDRDTYLSKRALDSTKNLKHNMQARTLAFRKICAAVIQRHVSMSMQSYEKRHFSEDTTTANKIKKTPRYNQPWSTAANAFGDEEKYVDTGIDPRFVAPLPRFDYGLVMGLAEQMELQVFDCFKIAEQEWKLGLQELNIRISIRLDMEDQGIRPRISSLNPMLAEIASLPTIKKVGTPVHMDN